MPNDEITASPVDVPLGGKTLRVSPLNDRDISELNEWVRAQFIKMARLSLEGESDPAMRKETLQLAMSDATAISWMSGRGASMMATPDGLARIIWQGAHHNHEGLKYEYVRALMMKPGSVNATTEAIRKIKPRAPAGVQEVKKRGPRKSPKAKKK